jgi:hypothetical protein
VTKDTLLRQIAAEKAEFDRLRPQAPHGLDNLNQSYEIELTYTSNTIESNPLTAPETRWDRPLRDILSVACRQLSRRARHPEQPAPSGIKVRSRIIKSNEEPVEVGYLQRIAIARALLRGSQVRTRLFAGANEIRNLGPT